VWGIPVGEMLRGRVETTLNENLAGYSVDLAELRLDVLGFGLRLIGVTVAQRTHPKPPMARIEEFGITVDWRALFRARLVADLELDSPQIHIDRRQFEAEVADNKNLGDKGWQEAVEAIYPLKINRFGVINGSITYIDSDPEKPVKLDAVAIAAENIRNVRSPDDVYPSTLRLDASLFETGTLTIDGKANFLAEPQAAFDVDLALANVPLVSLDPVSDNVNIEIRKGLMAVEGHVEYAPKKKNVYLQRVRIDGIAVDYVTTERTRAAEEQRMEAVEEAAKDVSNEPDTRIFVDRLEIRDGELGYTTEQLGYRVFVGDADITLENLGTQQRPEPAKLDMKGRFLGAGDMTLAGIFEPVNKQPRFDFDLRIESTPLAAMNDILRAHANFDVIGGMFAFYSEVEAKDGELRGYVKPLFTDMDVYDGRQESGKPVLRKMYEGVVGGLANVLENRRDDVAAKVDISGRLDNPNLSTLETLLSLIQNAFFRAIVPGLEEETRPDNR
jgi:hypothetical protein